MSYSHSRVSPIGSGRNIAAKNNAATPNTKLDISYDQLVLQDANGNAMVVNAGALTIDFGAAAGANGPDAAGAQTVGAWSYGWVISKPDGTTAGLGSASATAPTMPAGYIFKALATAAFTTAGPVFRKYRQAGNDVFPEARQQVLNGGAAGVETAVSLSTFIPPIATVWAGHYIAGLALNGGDNNVTANLRVVTGVDYFNIQEILLGFGAAHNYQFTGNFGDIPNVANQFFYLWSALNAATAPSLTVYLNKFKLPLGGE